MQIGHYRKATSAAAVLTVLVAVAACPASARNGDAREIVHQALADGDTLDAIHHLEQTDLDDVRDPELFVLLGRLYRSRGSIVDRLKSQRVLERAVQLFPDDPAVVQELAMTYFSQTFYPDAARYFKMALDIDPSLCGAKYKLGVTHYERWKLRVNSYFDDAAKARAWLKAALECDSTNVDAAKRYVNVLYGLDRRRESEVAARRLALRFPEAPHFPLMVGTISYEDGRMAEADSAYGVALARLSNEDYLVYTKLGRNVLGYDDLDEYEGASVEDQEVMDRAFWIVADPDPTTDINPPFLEHLYRTFRADVFFSFSKAHLEWTEPQVRGWETERGEVSIKFGWPDEIEASHGGWRWERWLYMPPGQIITFHFDDPFLTGKYQVPPEASWRLAKARHQNRVTRTEPPWEEVEGAIDAVVFRDSDLSSSLYVVAEVNANGTLGGVDGSVPETFHIRTRLFDDQWTVQQSRADTLAASSVPSVADSGFNRYHVVRRFDIPFDYRHVAFAFQDGAGDAISVLRCHADGSHLLTDGVVTSDILLLRDGNEGAPIERGERVLQPNASGDYDSGRRLRFYFEVYNLNVVGGRSRYRVTYEIHNDPESPPTAWSRLGRAVAGLFGAGAGELAAAQSFVRTGTSHTERERMAVDIGALSPGRHRLTVTVEDLQSNRRTQMRKVFQKGAQASTTAGATVSTD